MIWVVVIIVIGSILYRFFTAFNRDNYDLQNQSLSEKFEIIVNMVNSHAFNGHGTVTILDKRSFNLYQIGENQIIFFLYGTGSLTVTWKYKYFQKELIHEKRFSEVRNLSIFEQQRIAESLIFEMTSKVNNHKNLVLKDIPFSQSTIDLSPITRLKADIEQNLRNLLLKTLIDSQQLPKMMHGIIVMQAAGNFSKNLKGNYTEIKRDLETKDVPFLNKEIFFALVDEVTNDVLEEFIEFPSNKNSQSEDLQDLPF